MPKRQKIKIELDERDKIKSRRRARGGRTLPRSGGGVHEDKKSKKIEDQLEEEAEEEIRNWLEYKERQNASTD